MSNHNESAKITYTYSAKEQEEFKKIRQKYDTQAENKADRLRRLDAGVTRKATAFAYIFGVLGTLLYGFGMSITMTDILAFLGDAGITRGILGIALCVIGFAIAALAYPLYRLIVKKEREKIAPEILRLTEELIK